MVVKAIVKFQENKLEENCAKESKTYPYMYTSLSSWSFVLHRKQALRNSPDPSSGFFLEPLSFGSQTDPSVNILWRGRFCSFWRGGRSNFGAARRIFTQKVSDSSSLIMPWLVVRWRRKSLEDISEQLGFQGFLWVCVFFKKVKLGLGFSRKQTFKKKK